jgi:hypothetical protein
MRHTCADHTRADRCGDPATFSDTDGDCTVTACWTDRRPDLDGKGRGTESLIVRGDRQL